VGQRPHIAIVSYDLAAKIPKEYAARYRSIICDESHMLKSRSTARYRGLAPLVRRAARALLCTGTPLLNRPIEIWPQVDLLRPGLLGSFDSFGERYCLSPQAHAARQLQQQQKGGRGGYPHPGRPPYPAPFPGSEYRGAACLGELRAVLAECVMTRRSKRQVLADLPPKIRTKVPLQPCDDDLRPVTVALRELAGVMAAEARGQLTGRQAEVERQRAWTAAYRATGPAKCAEAAAFIDRLLQIDKAGPGEDDTETAAAALDEAAAAGGAGGGEGGGGAADGEQEHEEQEEGEGGGGPPKLLVFAHHQEVLDRLGTHLRLSRVPFIRIDGQVPPPQRQKAVASFQRTGPRTPRVALLALHAAGAGLTLTAASVVVFVELDQAPALLAQAEDRAHRVGQAGHVHVYYLMGKGTLDERIWAMLERKRFAMGAALDAGEEEVRQQEGEEEEDEQGGRRRTADADEDLVNAAAFRGDDVPHRQYGGGAYGGGEEEEQYGTGAAAAGGGGASGSGAGVAAAPAFDWMPVPKKSPAPPPQAAAATPPRRAAAAATGAAASPPAAVATPQRSSRRQLPASRTQHPHSQQQQQSPLPQPPPPPPAATAAPHLPPQVWPWEEHWSGVHQDDTAAAGAGEAAAGGGAAGAAAGAAEGRGKGRREEAAGGTAAAVGGSQQQGKRGHAGEEREEEREEGDVWEVAEVVGGSQHNSSNRSGGGGGSRGGRAGGGSSSPMMDLTQGSDGEEEEEGAGRGPTVKRRRRVEGAATGGGGGGGAGSSSGTGAASGCGGSGGSRRRGSGGPGVKMEAIEIE
ncbi:hypothetical protein Agub_g12180, partial [Astrephomene gubernaculifera]